MSDPWSARWSGVFSKLACVCWINIVVTAGKNALLEDQGPPPSNLPFEPLTSPPDCLPCERLFSQLKEEDGGGLVQRVEMTERG